MLDNNTLNNKKHTKMNKLTEIFSFIKNNLNGEYTHTFLIATLALILFKILGVVGLFIGLILTIAFDTCNTTNLSTIYTFIKSKFFPVVLIILVFTSCGTNKIISNGYYAISQMIKISKDTLSANDYHNLINTNKIPALSKFSKTYMKNTEENKFNAYYVYYDSLTNKLYNVKELINNRDTTYILEKKILK